MVHTWNGDPEICCPLTNTDRLNEPTLETRNLIINDLVSDSRGCSKQKTTSFVEVET